MPSQQFCHYLLEIPSSRESAAALSFSQKSYRRILANWASDLFYAQKEKRAELQLFLPPYKNSVAA